MSHVVLRTCTGQRSSHESQCEELYLNVFFFFSLCESVEPRGICLGLHRRSRFPWNVAVVWEESVFSKCFLLRRLAHQVDGIKCLPGVGERCARSLTDQQIPRKQFCFSFNNHKKNLVPPRRLTYAWYRLWWLSWSFLLSVKSHQQVLFWFDTLAQPAFLPQPCLWFGLTLAFTDSVTCYQTHVQDRLMKGDMWSLQSIPRGDLKNISF